MAPRRPKIGVEEARRVKLTGSDSDVEDEEAQVLLTSPFKSPPAKPKVKLGLSFGFGDDDETDELASMFMGYGASPTEDERKCVPSNRPLFPTPTLAYIPQTAQHLYIKPILPTNR